MNVLARRISIVLHPFACVILLVAAVELRRGPEVAARSVLAISLLFVLPLSLLMLRQVRRGAWKTVDASQPRERRALYSVGAVAMVALLVYLRFAQADSPLLVGAAGALAMLAVCAGMTRWIKVSLHMAVASLSAVILLRIGHPLGWALAAALPLLGWSRVALGRHRPAEVALGVAIGAVTGFAIVASG